jgi:UDP-glucose 4-epimerase
VVKALVTGGSGFIGSHVVDELLAADHDVTIYDVEAPRFGQECAFIRGDTRDLDRMTAAARNADVIYHLAAEANVNRFYESPLYSHDITATATLTVLEASRRAEVGRVLLASTEWVYGSTGEADQHLVTEDTPVASAPDHLYTSAKIAAELFCRNYHRLYGVDYTIMRFGIPFGERARPETVTPAFIGRLLRDEPITIDGDGSQTRQFIYVKDLARGNAACLHPAAVNEIFNLNGVQKVSVLQLVRLLEKLLERKARLRFSGDRKGNFGGRFISSGKAQRLVGWEPQTGYEQAMEQYVQWYLAHEAKENQP